MSRPKFAAAVRAIIALSVTGLFVYAYFSPQISANAFLAPLTRLQFSAALYGAGVAAGVVIAVIVITLIFGRVFCSVLCPLGTIQEVVWRLARFFRGGESPPSPALRRGLPPSAGAPPPQLPRFIPAVLAGIGSAVFASPFVIIFDPFSTFGGGLTAFRAALSGRFEIFLTAFLIFFLVIIALAFWAGRAFCRLCPVGFTLGLFSRFSPFRIRVTKNCVSCGKCEKNCPTRCISGASVRGEDCVLCLSCISVCPQNGIIYAPGTPVPVAHDSRRNFIKHTAAAAVYLLGPSLKFLFPATGRQTVVNTNTLTRDILPPGAINAKNFFSRCISCHACSAACPVKILKSDRTIQPVVTYNDAGCQFNCTECGRVCPTDAIYHLSADEKKRMRIALSHLNFERCVVKTKHESCGACAEVCPTGALVMTAYEEGGVEWLTRPEFDERYCIGCGACFTVCPAVPKAFVMEAVREQTFIAGARPSEKSGDELKVDSGADFPF